MPRGGSNKLPTAILEFRGTARKDRTNPNEPQSEKLTSKPPAWLDATARRHWFRLVKILHWLTESDVDVLAYYCQSHSRYRVLTRTLAELQAAEEPNHEAINAQMIRLEKAELSVRALAADCHRL